jgi:hypothetical protein
MTTILLENPSANAAENVARIKAAIAKANQEYITTKQQVTVQLGAGTWVVTGDKSNASAGAIELLSGVALTTSMLDSTALLGRRWRRSTMSRSPTWSSTATGPTTPGIKLASFPA